MTATDGDILERAFERLSDRPSPGSVTRTTVGDRLLAVEVGGEPGLDDEPGRRAGVAHRPPGDVGAPVPDEPLAVARWAFDPPTGEALERALGVATLNALSAPHVPWRRGDPMAALAPEVERIATVGLFRPALRKFDGVDVRVVEREPVERIDAPPGVSVTTYTPDEHASAIAGVDVLFVTGSSLVYGGVGEYLRAARDVPTVVLVGATASFLPGPAFDAGATVAAGARVTDPAAVRAGIEAGGCATDLHGRGLEKVHVAADPTPPGLELRAEGPAAGDGRD